MSKNFIPYADQPTKLEMAVALFQKQGSSEAIGTVHPISVRIPTIPYVSVQALAEHSGLSINKTIVQLLDVALDEVWSAMDGENQERLGEIRSRLIGNMIKDGVLDTAANAAKGEV